MSWVFFYIFYNNLVEPLKLISVQEGFLSCWIFFHAFFNAACIVFCLYGGRGKLFSKITGKLHWDQ